MPSPKKKELAGGGKGKNWAVAKETEGGKHNGRKLNLRLIELLPVSEQKERLKNLFFRRKGKVFQERGEVLPT